MAPLYVYVPTPNAVRAPNTISSPIVINANNVAFSPAIPSKLQNQHLEPVMEYLQSHPLRYAHSDIVDPFFPAHVCEFYYTCNFNSGTGTITDDAQAISITQTTVRNALRLPVFQAYPNNPSDDDCKDILPTIGYDLSLQGSRNGSQFFLRQCIPARWKLVTGVIGKCLGHKTGSLDQLNHLEMRILLAMVINRQLDFAWLIFDQLVGYISGKQCPATSVNLKMNLRLQWCPSRSSMLFPKKVIIIITRRMLA